AYWPGGGRASVGVPCSEADAIVAYGRAQAIEGIRPRAPAHTPVLDHGPRLSIGFVAGDALADGTPPERIAHDIARSVATFDQQGCVSPNGVYVEPGGDAKTLGARVVEAMSEVEAHLPRGPLTPDEPAGEREALTRAEFGGV